VAYTRRGEGPPVLLVHSIHAAAWSYEWRHNVDALARDHTVYTIDLLGFGRSDRPPLEYSARLYVSLLLDFTRDVVGGPCALVGSSLGAAFVVAVAARDPERFPAVVLVGPVGIKHLSWPPGRAGDATQALIRSPLAGSALFNALVTRPSMRFFLGQTYAADGYVTPELLEAYWRTAHQPGARYAAAAFVGMHLNLNVADAARRLTQPVLIAWGDQAKEVPRAELARTRSRAARAASSTSPRAAACRTTSAPRVERARARLPRRGARRRTRAGGGGGGAARRGRLTCRRSWRRSRRPGAPATPPACGPAAACTRTGRVRRARAPTARRRS
jgi:pimeloyl-ACP methyl ester carboxylesterase